jgi:hypothetical protein
MGDTGHPDGRNDPGARYVVLKSNTADNVVKADVKRYMLCYVSPTWGLIANALRFDLLY